ncbi:MAG: hypothetical protein U9N30_03380, partial [Campylobacterota bacterium]|nr:hypothetical protein [Campylobacterota bacterium]
MKKLILFFLLMILNLTLLNAQEPIKVRVTALCSEDKKENFTITINSNTLNLSQEAIIDNTGGYVDIPEDRYFLKTKDKVDHIKGEVVYSILDTSNQFISFITKEDLKNLQINQDIQFIQKIHLEKNNPKKISTTNILTVHLDEKSLVEASKKCKNQMKKIEKNSY